MTAIDIISCLLLLTLTLWSIRLYWQKGQGWSALCLALSSLGLLAIMLQDRWLPWAQNQLSTSTPVVAVVDSDQHTILSAALNLQLTQSDSIQLKGDGYRASQWQDVPARRLEWQKAADRPKIELQFESSMVRGREFVLNVRRIFPKQGGWRAQLLAENGTILVEEKAQGEMLTLRWLPPLAERMVLQAKVWDAEGKLLDSGPIPLEVRESEALHVWGRFDAASFDVAALQNLFRQSQAVIDWQTRLGQQIQHVEISEQKTPEQQMGDLMVVDAAYLEQLSAGNRQTLLARVGQGGTLLVLGANAKQIDFWRAQFELHLQASNNEVEAKKDAELIVDIDGAGAMVLSRNSVRVKASYLSNAASESSASNSIWHAYPQISKGSAYLWQRPWRNGQLVWLDVSDWHRHTISAPKKVAAWWQAVLDQVYQKPASAIRWSLMETMPVVGERQTVCLEGVQKGNVKVNTESAAFQLRSFAEILDQTCAGWRPTQKGWQVMTLLSPELQSEQQHAFYIYSADAWPTWQRYLKAQATEAYAQALDAKTASRRTHLPLWPLYLLTAVLLLCLWRRDTQTV